MLLKLMKKFFFLIVSLITISSIAQSKINDPRAWNNFYNGCIKEYTANSQLTKNEFQRYCSCSADLVMERFTSKELILLELNMRNLDKSQLANAALANEKFKKIIVDCLSRILK